VHGCAQHTERVLLSHFAILLGHFAKVLGHFVISSVIL
jgi:hypothetical protein